MPYDTLATATTPALIVYLLDVSASMAEAMDGRQRIEVVVDALEAAVRQMVFRSTKGRLISPRYHIAMLAYSDRVWDLLGGIKTIDEVARKGVPELRTWRTTDTALAFEKVEALLEDTLSRYQDSPAPLVCHMTDGEYTGDDPEPIVRRIMNMAVNDGTVLIENIFVSDGLLPVPITNAHEWKGILPKTKLRNEYAKKLRSISSPLPEGYRLMMHESGYRVADGALMMLPGQTPELVRMGFVMSMSTPFTAPKSNV